MVRGPAMAAPIVHLDEPRPNLVDVSGVPGAAAGGAAGGAAAQLLDGGTSPRESDGFGSVENLDGLDQNFSACFWNVVEKADSIGPVSVITEDTLLEKDEIWNALTGNHGHVMPVDWKRSRTRSLYISTFNLEEKPRETNVEVELSEEEELREQLDMHSIIVPCLEEEPLVTAEQVIEEIEEMMQDSPDMNAEHNPSQSDLSMLSLDVHLSSPGFEDRLRALSLTELLGRLKEMEANIRRFSEELVQQLAVRDELDFEKEIKNSFISALIEVQNRQKEHRESIKKKKKLKGGAVTGQGVSEKTASRFSMEGISSVIQNSFRQTFGSGSSERQYLTTVIPYEKKGHPPSLNDLQILTKILQAMRDDSDKVPGLLTDYILNVFCPT
uniref:Fasciculation and elongation protein zeta 2 (Zygin II) n=1 Tax=Iconisemion striatum TaxID=60296 RepID=A0A1A7WXW1_9TELE